jgi:integrase
MSVAVRPYRRGGWEVDIVWRSPDGRHRRERKRVTVESKSVARRWGEARERELLVHGPATQLKEVPTFNAFWPRFINGYALANRQKPSGVAAKETIGRVHLQPHLGSKRLDAITTERVQHLKRALSDRAPKTVNNVLTVLNVVLKKAVEWNVLERMPCTIRLLPIPKPSAGFYDFEEYESLVAAAKTSDPRAHLVVLLGGDAGLRCGEMMALEWSDVNLRKRQLCVQRSDWKGHVTTTKGGRLRYVPMTTRLAAALQAHRHLRSDRVLCQDDGQPFTQKIVQDHVRRAARRAQVQQAGVHRLRHTFCSHLAMRGAPARAIQELAGHMDLSTTQRYMHLSPAAIEGAIRLLESPGVVPCSGDIVETGEG